MNEFSLISFMFCLRLCILVHFFFYVLGMSYTCVVVSCLGSCVCDAML